MSKRGTNGTRMRFEKRRVIDQTLIWFVLQAAPMSERKAEEELRADGADVWVPRFYEVTVRRNRKVEGIHEFFPRYLFAGVPAIEVPRENGKVERRPVTLAPLYRCDHITDVLGADAPLAIPAPVLQVLADRMTGNVKSERLAAAAAFRVGEMRTVVKGPFASFMAEITELLANGRIMGDVSIFGRATPVEFEPSYLGAA